MDLKFQDVEGIFHLSNYCNFFLFLFNYDILSWKILII